MHTFGRVLYVIRNWQTNGLAICSNVNNCMKVKERSMNKPKILMKISLDMWSGGVRVL